jgi:hypothetical protein
MSTEKIQKRSSSKARKVRRVNKTIQTQKARKQKFSELDLIGVDVVHLQGGSRRRNGLSSSLAIYGTSTFGWKGEGEDDPFFQYILSKPVSAMKKKIKDVKILADKSSKVKPHGSFTSTFSEEGPVRTMFAPSHTFEYLTLLPWVTSSNEASSTVATHLPSFGDVAGSKVKCSICMKPVDTLLERCFTNAHSSLLTHLSCHEELIKID